MCAGHICGISLNTFVITKWKWSVVIRKNNGKIPLLHLYIMGFVNLSPFNVMTST